MGAIGTTVETKVSANPVEQAQVVTTAALDQRATDAAHEQVSQQTEVRISARERFFQAEMELIAAEKALYAVENAGFSGLKYSNQCKAWVWRRDEFKSRHPSQLERWLEANPKPARPSHLSEIEALEIERQEFGT